MLTFLTGGARSGKSAAALRLARRSGAPVVFVATAEAGDDEMAARIARHRDERPDTWTTVQEPVDLAGALDRCPAGGTVIVDCLTLWLMNVLARPDDAVLDAARAQAARAAARPGLTVVVTNEVGAGIVPADPLSRRYRDLLGAVNAIWSHAADRAYLAVAGRLLPLAAPEDVPE